MLRARESAYGWKRMKRRSGSCSGFLVNRNKGIEINTSGLRQAVKEQFPSRTLLKWYREEGGTIVTVGSDAHCRQDVGKGIQEAEKLLQELGFPYISRFRERKLLQEKVRIR